MYKIRNIYAYSKKIEDKLQNTKKEMKVQCPKCFRKYSFYAFEDKDRKLCTYCGIWVYKNEEVKKKYDKEDFERKLKKYMKESNKNVNRTKGRNLGTHKNTNHK